jgi:hypothetical protein
MRLTRSVIVGSFIFGAVGVVLFACGDSDRYLSGSSGNTLVACQDCSGYCCFPPYLQCCPDKPCVEPDGGAKCDKGEPPYLEAGAGYGEAGEFPEGSSSGDEAGGGGCGSGSGGSDGVGGGGTDGTGGGGD